ncbi:Uncharacterised protein [Mycobacteroides abscessus subsp. abscessus]|nr:Uncharacterised protein [Mycobacteroides abscessus subsp. abscessus]
MNALSDSRTTRATSTIATQVTGPASTSQNTPSNADNSNATTAPVTYRTTAPAMTSPYNSGTTCCAVDFRNPKSVNAVSAGQLRPPDSSSASSSASVAALREMSTTAKPP